MKLAYLLLSLAVGLLACGCASGPREPMPPDIPEQMEEYFVEFKAWTEGGQIRAEKLNTPQTREPKGEAPRAFRVTLRLTASPELVGYATVARGAYLYPPYEKDFGRIQSFWQWEDKGNTRNIFATQSFGDTSETWHECRFLFRADSFTEAGKNSIEFKVLLVFDGDDAWTLKAPSLTFEAQNYKSLRVPLFAEK